MMKAIPVCIALLLFLSLGVPNSYGQTHYTLTELNVASAGRGMNLGLNNLGQVAGQPTGSLQFAWTWDAGTLTELGALGTGDGSAAYDINDAGHVVGSSGFLTGNTTGRAFIYANGVMHDLTENSAGLDNVAQNYATSINASSQVTGWAVSDGRPGVLWNVELADPANSALDPNFATTFSTFRKPLAINDNGDAAGATLQFENGLVREADGTLFDLGQIPGSSFFGSWARDINNSNVTVGGGSYSDFGNVRHAARWDKVGSSYDILDLHDDVLLISSNAHSSDALAINESGLIAGWYAVGANDFATVWDPAFGSLTLYDQLLETKGWTALHQAHDINEFGQILVSGRDANAQIRLALLTPAAIPEPSSLGSLVCVGLVFLTRRRRR